MTYKLRLMRAENAVLAALMPSGRKASSGLKPWNWILSSQRRRNWHIILSAACMIQPICILTAVLLRRRCRFCWTKPLHKKEAVLSDDGQQALLESTGDQSLWLLYDGIAEDRLHYRFWLVRCEGPDWLHCDGQWQSEGEYTIPIREAEDGPSPSNRRISKAI